MGKTVVFLDGPIGVGKTTLGRHVATELACGFIDGDDCSEPGHWLRSIRRTSRKIVSASAALLHRHPVVIVSYPLRRTNWAFFHETFRRMDIDCHCIGLHADITAISNRERRLDKDEIARSEEMIMQGYGQRVFSHVVLPTDTGSFEETAKTLQEAIQRILTGP